MPMFEGPQTSGKLLVMLESSELTPQQLFSVPDIVGDIKQKIQTFLGFCQKKRQFTHRMLSITLNSQYSELQEYSRQKVAQLASEILSSDENATSDFLFGPDGTMNNSSSVSQKIEAEESNIQLEAEKLFSDDEAPKMAQQNWYKEVDAFEKYELVKLTLAHLKQEKKNETCLGYINKIYASLLRKEGCQFLDFLQENNEYITLLIENIHFSSVANLLSLILACEDKTRQYKFESFKQSVFAKLLDYSFFVIKDDSRYQGFLSTVEQILNSTKQSYYEYFEDFKRCANALVEQKTLLRFMAYLKSENETQFSNAVSYLEIVLKRINTEDDEQDYYRQNQSNEPSMKFQHSCLLQQFESLLEIIPKTSNFSSMTKLSFLNMLVQILKNLKGKAANFDNLRVFKKFMEYYDEQKSRGMLKNYLFQLLKLGLKRMQAADFEALMEWMVESGYNKGFIGDLENIEANKNCVSCFGYSICFEIQQKQEMFLQKLKQMRNLSMSHTYEKFSTKLADYGKKSSPNSVKDDQFILNFEIPQKKTDKSEKTQRAGETQVGKNNVMIPTLVLPTRSEGKKITIEEEEVESLVIPEKNIKDLLIQDLKNTKIQLPMKFRPKKTVDNPPEEQIRKLQNNLLDKSAKSAIIHNEVQILQISKAEKNENVGGEKGEGKKINEKFFVNHLLIF